MRSEIRNGFGEKKILGIEGRKGWGLNPWFYMYFLRWKGKRVILIGVWEGNSS